MVEIRLWPTDQIWCGVAGRAGQRPLGDEISPRLVARREGWPGLGGAGWLSRGQAACARKEGGREHAGVGGGRFGRCGRRGWAADGSKWQVRRVCARMWFPDGRNTQRRRPNVTASRQWPQGSQPEGVRLYGSWWRLLKLHHRARVA